MDGFFVSSIGNQGPTGRQTSFAVTRGTFPYHIYTLFHIWEWPAHWQSLIRRSVNMFTPHTLLLAGNA
jgi:hypothetical protein